MHLEQSNNILQIRKTTWLGSLEKHLSLKGGSSFFAHKLGLLVIVVVNIPDTHTEEEQYIHLSRAVMRIPRNSNVWQKRACVHAVCFLLMVHFSENNRNSGLVGWLSKRKMRDMQHGNVFRETLPLILVTSRNPVFTQYSHRLKLILSWGDWHFHDILLYSSRYGHV